MISGSVFSTADLRDMGSRLFGKIKYNGEIVDCELLYENEEEETTEISFIDGDGANVKTKRIFDLVGYTPALGEHCPINWRLG